MTHLNVLAFVMAGGEGTRLWPFTKKLPKPALPFGGGHRIIDFVLSNLHHSGIHQIYVLTQYRPKALLEHVAHNWAILPQKQEGFVTPVLPDYERRGTGFHGTADAIYQNLHLIKQHAPDLIAVFAADHVYRMDIRQMIDFHLERSADVSVAAVPVPIRQAASFGIIEVDHEQCIRGFQEKPDDPAPMPNDSRFAYASMGNYLFRPMVLLQALLSAAERGDYDFGQHVLPRIIHEHRVYAYDFTKNRVPGVAQHEEPGYWRDIGNIESYVAAHREILGPKPSFRLNNPEWPILGRLGGKNVASDSILGHESAATGASLRDSVLQSGVTVEPDARVENCIVMEGATIQRGAWLRNAVVGTGSVIAPHTRIGYDLNRDRLSFTLTPTGIVVIPPFTFGRTRRDVTGISPVVIKQRSEHMRTQAKAYHDIEFHGLAPKE